MQFSKTQQTLLENYLIDKMRSNESFQIKKKNMQINLVKINNKLMKSFLSLKKAR